MVVSSGAAARRERVVEHILDAAIRHAEPVLQKINPQHDAQAYRFPLFARLWLMWRNQGLQLRPANHIFHGVEKLLTTAGSANFSKTWLAGKCYLALCVFAPPTIEGNCDVGAGLNQRLSGVVRHADCRLKIARARLTFPKMSAVLAVQMKGLGSC